MDQKKDLALYVNDITRILLTAYFIRVLLRHEFIMYADGYGL